MGKQRDTRPAIYSKPFTEPAQDHCKIEFGGEQKPPQCPPNQSYLSGMHIDYSMGAKKACVFDVPAAKGTGFVLVECMKCGYRAATTVAGRPDDVRSVKIPCKITPTAPSTTTTQ
jgi:hypothetical protein